jgi:nucleoside-diphosphate-sugar epimerase
MKLFVTGGTGFIGSYFLRAALARGHDVVALRRRGAQSWSGVTREPVWIEGDLESDYRMALVGVTTIVHLAAAGVSPQRISWADAIRWNVAALDRLIDLGAGAGVRRIIVGGTCQEYGRTGERFERIPVDAPLEPVGAYAASKAAASLLAGAKARELGLELAVLRPFHCFGNGQHEGNFWPALRQAAVAGGDFPMTPGEQVLDFSPVELVAEEFLRGVESLPLTAGQPLVVNVGSGRPARLADFAQHWWDKLGATGRLQVGARPYRGGELMRLVPELSMPPRIVENKLERELGGHA